MLETLHHCPICEGTDFDPFLTCEDYTVSHEKFNIVKCKQCNFLFTNPRPDAKSIGKYYQAEAYISHTNTNKGIINKIYQLVRKKTLKNKLNIINGLSNSKSGILLDVGCGTGAFLEVCQQAGWQVRGVEPDENARALAQQKIKSSIHTDITALNEKNYFDTITLWHVLEHVNSLEATIIQLKSLLKEQGKLIIAVPNHLAKEAISFQEYWAAYDVPRHLYHFTPNSIKQLFEKYDCKVVQTIPMKYDAFYISLLSSKYKTRKTQYFKAFLEGWKSNQKAKKTNNYSSLIYIIEKNT